VKTIGKIMLGTAQFGLDYGINNTSSKPGQQAVNQILIKAYDSGVRCLDTAEVYGNAHEIIGDFHKQYPSRVFDVITKLPPDIDGGIDEKIEKYLNELNVTQLEGLLFHSYQTYKESAGSMKLIDDYRREGKVKYLGVSVYTNEQAEDVMEDQYIDIIQLPFNLFDNTNLRGEVIKKAKNKGKIVHTRSTFLQGLFFTSLQKKNKISLPLAEELGYINQLSKLSNISLSNISLNYCLQQPHIDNVLIGVDNLDQLNHNLEDAGYNLPKEVIDKINTIYIKNVELLNASLWHQ
jgi:aryl-alcohol dehydrogenase-like predicted oxidoreductase